MYGFGTKKIFLKMENLRLFVRYGGGVIGLQEFLGANLGPELERVQQRENMNLGEQIRTEVEGRDGIGNYGSVGKDGNGMSGKNSFLKKGHS